MSIKHHQCHFENPPDTDYCGKCATPLKPLDGLAILHTKTLQTLTKDLIKGTTFAGKYQIVKKLGEGARKLYMRPWTLNSSGLFKKDCK